MIAKQYSSPQQITRGDQLEICLHLLHVRAKDWEQVMPSVQQSTLIKLYKDY